jgi:hypothetical protein
MKIIVAIPVYDGKLQVQVVQALLMEQVQALANGDDLQIRFLPNCSHPAMGRNQLAQDFMNSDADKLVFLDADITFNPGDLVKLAHLDLDFVGGAYRFKHEPEQYPVGFLDTLPVNRVGCIEVKALPTGFLSLSKKVFEELKKAHPEREYEHFGKKFHCWFQMKFEDGALYGEDSLFCKEWRALGQKVWLDPSLTLTHWNFNQPFTGNVGKWLLAKQKQGA